MKVGISFSRCILDIVEERVNMDSVLVVIARTDFDPNIDEEWESIWQGYVSQDMLLYPAWHDWRDVPDASNKFRAVTLQLWNDGKFHQPRKFGAYPIRRYEHWLETCLPSSELERNPAAKKAWDHFQTIAGLVNVTLDKDYK
jgi:hypothetical protein